MTIFAALTVREALRRRVLLALALLTLALVALTGWGFQRVTALAAENQLPTATLQVVVSQLLILVMFMFSFVVGMTAVLLASPAVSGEIESGVALAILARPIRRSEALLGKWIGVLGVVVAYAVVAAALELAAVAVLTGYAPPAPLAFLAYLAAETAVGVTLALLLSTVLPPLAGGAVAVVLFGLAWIAGVASGIGAVLNNDTLVHAGTVSRLLVPTDGLWRGAVHSLEPAAMLLAASRTPAGVLANPFFVATPPNEPYLAWVAVWAAIVLGLAVLCFRRREL